jgi:hypothetical protein
VTKEESFSEQKRPVQAEDSESPEKVMIFETKTIFLYRTSLVGKLRA